MEYRTLVSQVAGKATIIAVSKMQSADEIMQVYDAGCRDFGESRLQEASEKMTNLPDDIRWHFIGTLQKNKVKKTIGKFVLIHSVDTPELAKVISEYSVEEGIETAILLQVNTSGEASKHGLSANEWKHCFHKVLKLPSIKIEGLMTMAPLTEDKTKIRNCFKALRELRQELEQLGQCKLPYLSMGMSNDYQIALEEGANLLRIGTAIFGKEGH